MSSRKSGPKSFLELYVGLMGGSGFLFGLSPLLGSGVLGKIIAGIALIASVGALIEQISKRGFPRAFAFTAGGGLISFGFMFGFAWFFTGYLAAQPNLFALTMSGSIAAEATARANLPSATALPLHSATTTVAPAIAAPTPTPVVSAPPALSRVANVFNGGNLREQPDLQGRVLDQINAGEHVELRAKNAQGTWYQVVNLRGKQGWVSATLLSIAPETASEVPIAP